MAVANYSTDYSKISQEYPPTKIFDDIHCCDFRYIPFYKDYEKQKQQFSAENYFMRNQVDLAGIYSPDTAFVQNYINFMITKAPDFYLNDHDLNDNEKAVSFENVKLSCLYLEKVEKLMKKLTNVVDQNMARQLFSNFYNSIFITLYQAPVSSNCDQYQYPFDMLCLNNQALLIDQFAFKEKENRRIPNFTLYPGYGLYMNIMYCYYSDFGLQLSSVFKESYSINYSLAALDCILSAKCTIEMYNPQTVDIDYDSLTPEEKAEVDKQINMMDED